MLRDKFGGFQAVGCQDDAVAIFFQHTADEFAHADGIVGNHHNAFVMDTINGVGRNAAFGNGRRARRKNTRSTRRCLNGFAFAWLAGNHAIQIEKQNQAAVGSNRGARKKFYTTEIFTKTFDDDFVFAENFFDHQADLAIIGICDDHAEISVDGFERRQAEIGIETNDFGDHVANFCKELPADIFNFIGAQTANFFDYSQGQRKIRGTTAQKQSR